MNDKRIKTMDRILAVLAGFLFLFVVVNLIIFCVTGSVPDVLITCVFAACTGELSVMGWIKTTKEKLKGDSDDEQID